MKKEPKDRLEKKNNIEECGRRRLMVPGTWEEVLKPSLTFSRDFFWEVSVTKCSSD